MFKILIPAVVLAALSVPASAAPHIQDAIALNGGGAQIIRVFGGCGPYAHRGPYGGCRPGGQWGGYRRGRACPIGFHLGPYGRRCWPN